MTNNFVSISDILQEELKGEIEYLKKEIKDAIDVIEAYAFDGNWSSSDPTKWTATKNGRELAMEFLTYNPYSISEE